MKPLVVYLVIGLLYTAAVWMTGYLAGQGNIRPQPRDKSGKFVSTKPRPLVNTTPSVDSRLQESSLANNQRSVL